MNSRITMSIIVIGFCLDKKRIYDYDNDYFLFNALRFLSFTEHSKPFVFRMIFGTQNVRTCALMFIVLAYLMFGAAVFDACKSLLSHDRNLYSIAL